MRSGVLALALAMASAVVVAPGAVAEEAASCTWTASQVPAPEGHLPTKVTVVGAANQGNYAGYVTTGTMDSEVVIWTDGKPRIADELGNVESPWVRDVNSSGTVLLDATFLGNGRQYKTVLLSGAHTGRGTVTELIPPAGYESMAGYAVNDRGDVLTTTQPIGSFRRVLVLYSAFAAEPVVIEVPDLAGADLDDDGTVLIQNLQREAYLWRAGQVTPLAVPPGGTPHVRAIRSGKVIGGYTTSWPTGQAVLWKDPATVSDIEKAVTASAINKRGLILGRRVRSDDGPVGVWLKTRYQSDLPLPSGVRSVRDLQALADDDTAFGGAIGYGVIRWVSTCVGDPDGR